ncbi:Protein FAR1-RELATED SEQUENCE 5 [Glycine max]|nr:Protein FAR1-RELATED SEQUENCE 5 [Glycine max]
MVMNCSVYKMMYDSIKYEEVDMDDENEHEPGVNEEQHVDCSDAFNIYEWAQSIAYENGFLAVIMRSDAGMRGRTSFVLIGCERSGQYRSGKKDFCFVSHLDVTLTSSVGPECVELISIVQRAISAGCRDILYDICPQYQNFRRDTGSRKHRRPFKLYGKPVVEGQGWMMKLMCGSHNHELGKSLVGHPYVGRLSKDEKTIITDMTKSMVKPRNILLTLKEHNANSCTTIKQIYNARSAYHSSIRGSDTEKQHLMKLLQRDQYIHWHRLKDEDVVCDIFWCHPHAVKLCNACNLAFLIDSTYKTNRYRLQLLDFVGVTPTGMTFYAGFAYLEGEHVNNVVWALKHFRGLFLRRDALPGVIVIDRDLPLMNVVKTVFPECTNLLCRFLIDKNVKEKCKSLIGKKMHGSMSWMPGEVWLIVVPSISSMIALRSLKFLVHHGPCLLPMLTKRG